MNKLKRILLSTLICIIPIKFAYSQENNSSHNFSNLSDVRNQVEPPDALTPKSLPSTQHDNSTAPNNDKINSPPSRSPSSNKTEESNCMCLNGPCNCMTEVQNPSREYSDQIEKLNLKYQEWRLSYLIKIYESQNCITKVWSWTLLAGFISITFFLLIKIYSDFKTKKGELTPIKLDLKSLSIEMFANSILVILIITYGVFFYLYIQNIYPIEPHKFLTKEIKNS